MKEQRRKRPDSEKDVGVGSIALDQFPYIHLKEPCNLLKVVVVHGTSVVFFSQKDGDKVRVQWFAFYVDQWYSDFVRVSDENEVEETCDILLDQAHFFLSEVEKADRAAYEMLRNGITSSHTDV